MFEEITVSQKRRARSTCLPLYPLLSTPLSATIAGLTGSANTGQRTGIGCGQASGMAAQAASTDSCIASDSCRQIHVIYWIDKDHCTSVR